MLTVRDLLSARMIVEEYLPDRCDIYKPVRTENVVGGESTSYPTTPTYAGVPCEIRNIFATEQDSAGKFRQQLSNDIVFPYDTDVDSTCRVDVNGTVYEVGGVTGDQTNGTEKVAQVIPK